MSLTPDILASGKQKSLEELRGKSRRRLNYIFAAALIIIVSTFIYSTVQSKQIYDSYQNLRSSLLNNGNRQAVALVKETDDFANWLDRNASQYELNAFVLVNDLVYRIASFSDSASNSSSAQNSILLSILSGLVRLFFVLIASLKFWLLAIVAGAAWKIWKIQPYSGRDFLGQTGNGRYFFSGIRAGLDNLTDDGTPDVHVRGLICLPHSSKVEAQSSELAKLLQSHDALNETNLELIAILEAHKSYPTYIASSESHRQLVNSYAEKGLYIQTFYLLDELLLTHARLRGTKAESEIIKQQINHTDSNTPVKSQKGSALTVENFASLLANKAKGTLTPAMSSELANRPAEQIATVILAMQTGKCLGYEKAGGRWIQKTAFLQLSARAVLHSTENYGEQYSYDDRTFIRQSLIYACRRSAFGPVPLPVDVSVSIQAMRGWSELLLALPFELEVTADKVELFNLCWEIQRRFKERIVKAFLNEEQRVLDSVVYTKDDILFIPLKNLLNVLLEITPAHLIKRLSELMNAVSQANLELDLHSKDSEARQPSYATVLEPLNDALIKSLSENHEIAEKDIARWSALRVILYSHSWLSRQIGHFAVPDHSIVFAVYETSDSRQLQGAKGMVPMRTSRLSSELGQSWKKLCTAVHNAAIGNSTTDYNRLLNGEEVVGNEDLSGRQAMNS